MSLIFNANIKLNNSNIGNIKLENCKISFDNAKVTFSGNLSKEDRDKLKQAYTNNPSFDFSEILRNAEYDVFENRSNSVKMELPQYCYIEKYCIHFSIYEKENSISWNLPCASFSFKSTITHDFKILSVPFITFSFNISFFLLLILFSIKEVLRGVSISLYLSLDVLVSNTSL